MTKDETIQILQSIEDRAVDFPYMTACDWVAIAAAKRHLTNSIEVKEVDLDKEIQEVQRKYRTIEEYEGYPCTMYAGSIEWIARHFFELGLKAQKGE